MLHGSVRLAASYPHAVLQREKGIGRLMGAVSGLVDWVPPCYNPPSRQSELIIRSKE